MGTFPLLLTTAEWMALLRIAVGLWWVKSFFHKPLRRFVTGQMADWTLDLADNHPVAAYGALVRSVVVRTRGWLPYLILSAELAIGLGLVFGLLTPVAAAAAIFLNLNYLTLAGARPREKSVNPCYQCEQGQNLMMIAIEGVVLGTGAWAVWSLDALIGLF